MSAAAVALSEHLVAARLAGAVATSPASTLANCRKLAEGHPDYTFGLSDWRTATAAEALAAVREVCGGDPAAAPLDGPGWIRPEATVAAIERHRERLAAFVAAGGGRVLLATGHPIGLRAHYEALAGALGEAGCHVLTPLDDHKVARDALRRPLRVRFLGGVGCASDGGSLRHTHRSRFMEAMLDALGVAPDLVIGDHGMAGAAIERGVPALSIADVNDPALPLAQERGRTDAVLPIDDNLAPVLFEPITAAMLRW